MPEPQTSSVGRADVQHCCGDDTAALTCACSSSPLREPSKTGGDTRRGPAARRPRPPTPAPRVVVAEFFSLRWAAHRMGVRSWGQVCHRAAEGRRAGPGRRMGPGPRGQGQSAPSLSSLWRPHRAGSALATGCGTAARWWRAVEHMCEK